MLRRSPRLLALRQSRLPARLTRPEGYLPRRSQRLRDTKKKAFNLYNSHVPTVLDNLPLHIIAHHIFPYLDYQTRNSLNSCLPVWDRVRTKMKPLAIKKHETSLCVTMVGSMLKSLEIRDHDSNQWIYRGDRRIQRMIQMLSLFLKEEYFFIYTHFPNFREAFSRKIDEMRELAIQNTEDGYSRIWLDELVSLCDALRNKILTYEGEMLHNYDYERIPALSFI